MSVKHFFSWRAKRISSNDKLCSTVRTDNSSAMSSESLLRKGFWNIILDRELFFRTTLKNHTKCVFFRHEGMYKYSIRRLGVQEDACSGPSCSGKYACEVVRDLSPSVQYIHSNHDKMCATTVSSTYTIDPTYSNFKYAKSHKCAFLCLNHGEIFSPATTPWESTIRVNIGPFIFFWDYHNVTMVSFQLSVGGAVFLSEMVSSSLFPARCSACAIQLAAMGEDW